MGVFSVPLMNHHTIPKLGFGPYKSLKGKFYLPKILSDNKSFTKETASEVNQENDSQISSLPAEKLDSKKR